jgi:hypothetical protein
MIGSAGIVTASLPTSALGVDLKDFGGREGRDIGPALNRAVEEGGGAPINIGPGEFRLETPFVYRNREKFASSSRVPGLVLIGSGSRRTIIECTAEGGAAIAVAQERPYRFTMGGRLEGFTLRGNPKAPNQDGLRLSGAWNYTISDVEVDGFTGHGLSIPWREDLRWELADVEIIAGSRLARRSAKGGFSDETGLTGGIRMFGPGISPGTTIARLVDDKTLEMSAPATESGNRALEFVGNSDAFQSIVDLNRCRLLSNRGWGLWGGAGMGAVVSWTGTEVALNGAGGVFCGGNAWNLVGGAIYSNNGVGLAVDRVVGGPMMLNVERIEFDSNSEGHVWLKEIRTASFERCRFISHYYPVEGRHRPEIGLIIGNTPATRLAHGVQLKGCQFRSPPNESAKYSALKYSAIQFGAPGGYRHIEILDSPWITRALHHRLFENEPDPAANVLVREDGITRYASRTARAWAILERGSSQKIAAGGLVELVFDRVQGNFAGNAIAQRVLRAKAVVGSDQVELSEDSAGLAAGMPISDDTGRFVASGSTILAVKGKQVRTSSPATSSGEFRALIGGLRVPYAQVYEIDATVTLEGVTAGSAIDLALTVEDRIVRKSTVPAGASLRQSVTIRALLPLEAGVRVSLRIGHDGVNEILTVSGPESGGLSMIAAT